MRLRSPVAVALVILFVFGVSFAQKVTVDYDKEADFSKFKTYSWMPHTAAKYPFLALDMIGAVDHQLQAKGLQKVDAGGDILVNAYGSLTEGTNVSYDVDIYAAPGLDSPINWANGTPRPGNSTAVFVDKGTLVVDLIERQAKQIRWRGVAKAKIDPEKAEQSFEITEKAVTKMFRKYPAPK